MSTAAVSSSSLNQQLQSYFETRNSDLHQLGQALSSGNLADAQIAYNNITALGQGGPFASGNEFRSSQRQQDFNAIGQALQAGDLAGAQQAFAALKATGHHGQPEPPATPVPVAASSSGPEIVLNLSGSSSTASAAPGAATSSSGPEIVLNLSDNSSSASPEQITINIANATSGGGEQVSISVGNQGSKAEQITFNLNPNSNEQIVLNLLDGSSSSGSSSASATGASGGLSVSA